MVDACLADVSEWMPNADVERMLAIQDDGYECVALPETEYEPGALRLKLNMLGNLVAFVQAPESSKGALRVSRVGGNDRLEEGIEKEWFFEVDVQGLRATVGSYPFNPGPNVLESHLTKLDELLADGKYEGHWPVSIIMATKKKDGGHS